MSFRFRVIAVVGATVILAVALGTLGCTRSNNAGRIVGKWKVTELPPELAARMKLSLQQAEAFGVSVFYEFQEDGTFVRGMGFKTPEMERFFHGLAKRELVSNGRYRLLDGDDVELYDLGDDDLFARGHRNQLARVRITEPAMELVEGTTSLKLTRTAPQG